MGVLEPGLAWFGWFMEVPVPASEAVVLVNWESQSVSRLSEVLGARPSASQGAGPSESSSLKSDPVTALSVTLAALP